MPQENNSIKSVNWVLISACGFVLFLAMAILFSIYSDKLNNINASTYFFLLVGISLVAAGFLFGALRSHAKYSGKAYNGTVELGGPVVVLALVIFLGYKFRPVPDETFSATVNLFSADSAHASIDQGELTAYYGTAHVSKKISDGQIVLNEIPKEFRNKEITFIPDAEGYSRTALKKIIPANENVLNLYLEKLADSVSISGIVINKQGKAVRNAMVVFGNGLAKDSTDRYGNFHLKLPFKDGTETQVRVYQDDVLRYNNLVRLSGQSAVNIQLN